jgi:hypothetical protein
LESIEWIHSDHQPVDLSDFTVNQLPCVVIRTRSHFKILLTRAELKAMKGDLDVFRDSLEMKLQLSDDKA